MQRQTVEWMAKASWTLPGGVLFLNSLATNQGREILVPVAYVGVGVGLLTLLCGVIALLTVRRFGKEKILVHALVGTCLSGALLMLMGATIFAG